MKSPNSEQRHSNADNKLQKTSDSVSASKGLDLTLAEGPRIMLGICAFLMALMIYTTAPWSDPVALFCSIVAATCLTPAKARPYFGDLIAVAAITLSIWGMYTAPKAAETNSLGFFLVVGLFGGVHLIRRYKCLFVFWETKQKTNKDVQQSDELNPERADVRIPILLRLRYLIVALFFGLSLFYAIDIDGVFDKGFDLAVKTLSIPLAVLCVLIIKSYQKQLEQLYKLSGIEVWLYGMLIVYPTVIFLSWPYLMAVNASTGHDNFVIIGGVITEKNIHTGRRGRMSYYVKGQAKDSGKMFSYRVHKHDYDLLEEGDSIYRTFYSGGFDFPWRLKGHPPQPDQIIPAPNP